MGAEMQDDLDGMLTRLKPTAVRDQLDTLLDEAARSELTLRDALAFLCEREIARKGQRRRPDEYGEVVWKFAPHAAEDAATRRDAAGLPLDVLGSLFDRQNLPRVFDELELEMRRFRTAMQNLPGRFGHALTTRNGREGRRSCCSCLPV